MRQIIPQMDYINHSTRTLNELVYSLRYCTIKSRKLDYFIVTPKFMFVGDKLINNDTNSDVKVMFKDITYMSDIY